jgi:AraC family transcriptional regulator, regulatory protein of adaptative response / DNA-3-methyladenine glycosylase II
MQNAATQNAAVQLAYRPPYDVQAMLRFLRTRQLNTIESVADYDDSTAVRRTLAVPHFDLCLTGWISAAFDEARGTVTLTVADSLAPALPLIAQRLRATLDLDADPVAINAVLTPHFPGTEGLRVPGSLDGFELAVRAVMGQQVTVAAGRTFAQRLVDRFGSGITTPWPELCRLFPSPQALADADPADIGALGIVRQRQAAIQALARAVLSGQIDLNSTVDPQGAIERLKALPGIGDWTAQYIAMRALRWADAFPAGDVALHKALGVQGHKKAAQEAEALSQVWRPWRSYAVLRAWGTL